MAFAQSVTRSMSGNVAIGYSDGYWDTGHGRGILLGAAGASRHPSRGEGLRRVPRE